MEAKGKDREREVRREVLKANQELDMAKFRLMMEMFAKTKNSVNKISRSLIYYCTSEMDRYSCNDMREQLKYLDVFAGKKI